MFFRASSRIACMGFGAISAISCVEPPVEKLRQRGLARFKVRPALHCGDKARAFDLCLSFGSPERVPLPLTLAGFRIAYIKDNCKCPGDRSLMCPADFIDSLRQTKDFAHRVALTNHLRDGPPQSPAAKIPGASVLHDLDNRLPDGDDLHLPLQMLFVVVRSIGVYEITRNATSNASLDGIVSKSFAGVGPIRTQQS